MGSVHRFRDAIQTGWPVPLAIEEHSHADMAARYQSGASGLPFAIIRGYIGSDLPKYNANIKSIACPSTGELLAATPALKPEVAIIPAQKADRKGNVCFVGIGKPSAAANLARLTHAPDTLLIYESRTKPNVLPLSIGDGELADTADTVVSVPEIFRYWLQGGRVDVGCLGELSLSAVHPGVTVEQVRELTGWSLRVSDDVSQRRSRLSWN